MTGSIDHVYLKTFTFEKNFNFKATEPVRGDSLLFATQPPGLSGTYLINLVWMKDWVDFGSTQQFWTWDPSSTLTTWSSLVYTYHLLFIYKQTLFNFSDIQLEQQMHFLHNPFFIHSSYKFALKFYKRDICI